MRHTGRMHKGAQTYHKTRGVAAVEFAIVLPLLVLVFTGMIEYGRLMWHYDALAKATRDAARFLSMEQPITDAKKTVARMMVISATAAAGMKDENGPLVKTSHVEISCAPVSDCTATPTRITVSIVAYEFIIGDWVPVFGNANISATLSPHTTMPYMR